MLRLFVVSDIRPARVGGRLPKKKARKNRPRSSARKKSPEAGESTSEDFTLWTCPSDRWEVVLEDVRIDPHASLDEEEVRKNFEAKFKTQLIRFKTPLGANTLSRRID